MQHGAAAAWGQLHQQQQQLTRASGQSSVACVLRPQQLQLSARRGSARRAGAASPALPLPLPPVGGASGGRGGLRSEAAGRGGPAAGAALRSCTGAVGRVSSQSRSSDDSSGSLRVWEGLWGVHAALSSAACKSPSLLPPCPLLRPTHRAVPSAS